jgi:Carbohydrate esterase 2 N-terminal/GDSL-like Lipase/Acylhydrolase family
VRQLYIFFCVKTSRHCLQLLMAVLLVAAAKPAFAGNPVLNFFAADNPAIQYTGRIDFSNPKLPRFWQPGVYITAVFSGTHCEVIVNDEVLWGKNHNYIEIVVDGVERRLQTKSARDTIVAAAGLTPGKHTLLICKNTEANIGYLELVGLRCQKLFTPPAKPSRKIEFIGNSITCAAGSDLTGIPCGKGEWHDQHNAYLGYAAITARAVKAQYHLSAVSGIGLMHSCCNMNIIMPPVFDKISMRNDTIHWDFKKYQPDIVTVCLGQNDGIQDSAAFCNNYIAFITQLRKVYPAANIICLSSPMADAALKIFMVNTITAVVAELNRRGDRKLSAYFFSKQYHKGCDSHPDLAEHREIANELTAYIKKKMKW